MLVLTRRVGESVKIGHDVTVTVLEVRGDVIRLGIDAPRSVQVHREEVYDALQEANREAMASRGDAVALLTGKSAPAQADGEPDPASE
jgi:carbon storage regulator